MNRPKYPDECAHHCGDSVICDTCRFTFEKQLQQWCDYAEAKLKEQKEVYCVFGSYSVQTDLMGVFASEVGANALKQQEEESYEYGIHITSWIVQE